MAHINELREDLREIDLAAGSVWNLGKNLVVGWTPEDGDILICFAPSTRVLGQAASPLRLLDGPRMMDQATFGKVCRTLRARPLRVTLPRAANELKPPKVDPEAIDFTLRRYSIMRTDHRAMMLFDIVGFAEATPIEQVARLVALEHSITAASERLAEIGLSVQLSRSTAGDGYLYVWNRNAGFEADLRAYAAMVLILLDNAATRREAGKHGNLTPTLRAAFTIGSHYSYHQVDSMKPRSFDYATGQTTIALARILSRALPGQILMGAFNRPLELSERTADPLVFLAHAERLLARLRATPVDEYRSLVTGGAVDGRNLPVVKYDIADKHGTQYQAFNLRARIARDGEAPVELGLQPLELKGFGGVATAYELPVEIGSAA